MTDKKLSVLLTNDDGYHAPGLQCLHRELKRNYTVVIAAPDSEQSGISHAFTYKKPLFYTKQFEDVSGAGYAVQGTPADCIKFAMGQLLSEKPDVVISGINDGSNAGVAGYYSGTVGGAREGALWQIPSIAFSVAEKGSGFFPDYAPLACQILESLLLKKKWRGASRIFYNVNFPSCHPRESAGIRITRQSLSFYDDSYTPKQRGDGRTEYWLHGGRKDIEDSEEYDVRALENKFITITPLHCDATASEQLSELADFEKCFKRGVFSYE